MRILLGVHQFFPDHYTGTERYVLNLAKQLQRMGHYVKVLTYAFRDKGEFREDTATKLLYKEYSYEGVPVIAIRHRDQPDDLVFVFDFLDMQLYRMVKTIFESKKFDLYHCAHPLRIDASIKAAADAGVRVVLMVTDYFLMCPMGIMLRSDNTLCDGPDHGRNCLKYCFTQVSEKRMKDRIARAEALLQSCDQLLSPSKFLIGLFNIAQFIPVERFILSRHGFDYQKKKKYFSKEPGEVITFGYIGTVQYHKGVHVMVEGFKAANCRNTRLKVWGGCFHEEAYQKTVMKIAGNDPRIEFKGSYNFNDIETILEEIDVVIVPSIWYENAPLTISTSLAYGIPVITSDIGGMSEAVEDGRTGLTFRVGDPLDLAEKIRLLADNPDMISGFKEQIQYPIRVEDEAFNTELVYKKLVC
ncbi:MAG: glycosyltransferase family 4 protein [Nitrospirae bacterium]|nr:glycosyltransferase family 4 protein [Nitrospirota bacterium]